VRQQHLLPHCRDASRKRRQAVQTTSHCYAAHRQRAETANRRAMSMSVAVVAKTSALSFAMPGASQTR